MKKHLLVFTIFLLFPILLFSNLPAEKVGKNMLASSAGTMNLDPQSACGSVPPQHNGDEVLDAGDVLRFVLHDNSGATLGNILDGQGGAMQGYGNVPGVVLGTTYYLSAIAGMDDGTGNVDLTDPELSVAPGTPVVFNEDPTAVGSSSNVLDCNILQTTLSAAGSSTGSDISYTWQGINGNAVGFSSTGFEVMTSQEGTYILTVTNTITGCNNSVIVNVELDDNVPIAFISSSGTLTCNNSFVTLDGSGSSIGPNIVYEWYVGGSPIPGSTGLIITVTTPGDYSLIVTKTDNGCTTTAAIVVIVDIVIPIADAGPDMVLDCNNPTVFLNGFGSSTGNQFFYQWTTFDGTIVSGGNTLNPEVNLAGTYSLIVTDANTGCTQTDEVQVTGDGGVPIDLGDDTYFDCTLSEMLIVGDNVPSGAGITYQWTTSSGTIVGATNSETLTISSIGTYVLEVNDSNLGCVGSDEIVVYDFDEIVSVTENMSLECNTSIPNQLDASTLLPNLNLTYNWTTTNGTILTGADMLNPIVSSSVGTYNLTFTDDATECSGMATIQMDTFLFPTPILNIQGTPNLSCTNNTVLLDASESNTNPPGGALIFQWEFNGVPFSNNSMAVANQPGYYQVLIFDQNGCLHAADTNVIYVNLFTLEDTLTLDCNNNFTQEVGPVLGVGQNVGYSWNDSDGNEISTDSSVIFTGNMEGNFELVVSDGNFGCVETATIEIVSDGFGIDITTTPAGCDLEDGTATATSGLPNSLVEWSTGEQGGSISGLAQGWYSVTVTDTDNNCSRHDNFFVDEDISCKVVISGYVLEDPNNTCTYDVNLTPVECVMVKLDPLGIYTLTDSTGYYEFVVDDGSYTVEFIGSAEVDLQCPLPGTYDVTLNTNGLISADNHFYVTRQDFDLCITKNTGAARPGFQQFNCVQICNYGEDSADAVVTFTHDNLFLDQTPWPNISPAYGNLIASTYTYDVTNNTFTWNLDDLAPGECRKIMWFMPVPVTAMIGEVIYSEAKVNPIVGDFNPANNCLAWTQTVTGSYDPNDKRNFIGESEFGGPFYDQDMPMEYAIRFQNVGNDTAFTVVVRDTLDDEHLDVTTIRGFTASHDMSVQFEDSNVLVFTFNDILLVDSMTNEPASNGWLNFNIDLKSDIPLHTFIRNQAAIYFDFNAPVITNELEDYFTNELSLFSPTRNTLEIDITPTVTNDEIRVHYVMENSNSVSMQIYNVGGVLLQEFDFGKKETGEQVETLSLKDFTAGVYFVFVKTEEGSAVRKVVKM